MPAVVIFRSGRPETSQPWAAPLLILWSIGVWGAWRGALALRLCTFVKHMGVRYERHGRRKAAETGFGRTVPAYNDHALTGQETKGKAIQ